MPSLESNFARFTSQNFTLACIGEQHLSNLCFAGKRCPPCNLSARLDFPDTPSKQILKIHSLVNAPLCCSVYWEVSSLNLLLFPLIHLQPERHNEFVWVLVCLLLLKLSAEQRTDRRAAVHNRKLPLSHLQSKWSHSLAQVMSHLGDEHHSPPFCKDRIG